MKKLLAISDVHIHNWTANAQFDQYGVSNRLKLYIDLANDIKKIALERAVDYIVVAGDISQDHIVTPEVANVISIFLDILSSCNCELILTVGQHDLSVKDNEFSEWHSIITPFVPNKPNVHYFIKENYVEISGVRFHVCPWTLVPTTNYKECDIFVGHGAIVGATNHSNTYTFPKGFSKEDLFNNYRVSIVGDVHHTQVYDKDGRIIIQPGNLHCNKYNDDPVAGMYYVELDETNIKYEFISNYDFEHSQLYYTFKTVNSYSSINENRPNTFEKLVENSVKKIEPIKNSKFNLNITELFKEYTNANNLSHLDNLFDNIFESSKDLVEKKIPSEVRLESIKVHNFCSIKNLDFKFRNWDDLLIFGNNGHGKSSLIESVFFCLTGKNSKKLDLDDLILDGFNDFYLSLTLIKDGKDITINRSRKDGTSSLFLNVDGGSNQKKSSISDTQKYIYDILGVTEEELLMFSYFSAENYKSFISIGDSDKYSVISKLSNTEKLDSLRKTCDEKIKELKEVASNKSFYLKQLKSDHEAKSNSLSMYLDIQDSKDLESKDVLVNKLNKLSDKIIELNSVKKDDESKFTLIVNKKKMLDYLSSDLRSYQEEFKNNLEKIKSLNSNVCFECNQSYHSNDLVNKKNSLSSRNKEIITIAKDKKQEYDDIKTFLEDNKTSDLSSNIRKLSGEIEAIKINISEINSKIAIIDKNLHNSQKIIILKEDVLKLNEKINIVDLDLEDVNSKLDHYKQLNKVLAKDGEISKTLLFKTCEFINQNLEKLLDGSSFKIKLQFKSNIKVLVTLDGNERAVFNKLSSGEKKIAELALIIAFINSYCEIYNLEKGLLGYVFLDEIFSYLDSDKLSLAKSILDRCYSNRIVITHESSLKNTFNHKILVKKDKYSEYIEIE